MNKLVKGNLVIGLPSKLFKNDQTCIACLKGKQHRASCKPKTENSVSLPLHLLHMDLFGPTFVKSLTNKMYCLVVINDYSRFTWVFFLATKDETSGILKSFITRIENLLNHKVKVIRCDNETEFKNREMNQFCEMKGILRQFSVARTPQQNEVVERWNMTLIEAAMTTLADFKSKPLSYDGKKVDDDPIIESECNDQEKEDNVNNTNNVNTVGNVNTISLTVIAASTNEVNSIGGKISIELPFDLKMPALEDDSIFDFSIDDEDDGVVADMNNLDTTIQVRRTKKVIHALKDPSWIEAMQEEFLQFKLQEVWTLVDLPNGKRDIGSKWVFKNKKDEKEIMIRNKARLVAQEYTQEEGIDYDEVFAPVVRIEAFRLFLAYASFKDFVVYQIDVKSTFLYGKVEEEVYVCQPSGFEDLDFPDRVYKVENTLYRLHQAPKAWFTEVKTASTSMETQKPLLKDEDGEDVDVHMYRSMIGSLMYLTSSRPDIMFAVYACAGYQVNPKVSHLYAVKNIFRNPKRKDIQVPQPSDPIEDVPDEAVHKELGDSLVRAATTASSLEAEQDSGNTLQSDEDRMKLDELMALCTNLQNKVLDLEHTKTTQKKEIASQHDKIASLKRRVKKLEKRNRSRTHGLKRLYKVGLSTRVESSGDEESLDEEEVVIDDIPLAVKSPRIVDWKIYKEGRKSYYKIVRADRNSQMYMIFSQMLKSFDKKELKDLYKLVKARCGSTRPTESMDYLLWSDIKIIPQRKQAQYAVSSEDQYIVNLDNSTSNVLIPLDSWTNGLLVYKDPLSGKWVKSL
nr:ribonuclease H-like domain-containing protein [Tanacetum cinerariifolium]